MINITVLSIKDRIACFHSLLPFLLNSDRRYRFTFTDDPRWCLTKDSNDVLIMVRMFIKPDRVDVPLLEALRNKYKTIAFFHDDAGGGIPRLEILPWVDLFYAKALFRDRALYGRELYGKELYSDYYHREYGINDPDPRSYATETRPEMLSKLRLSWNIGIGDFPREMLRQRIGVLASRAFGIPAVPLFYSSRRPRLKAFSNALTHQVHCRIGMIARPSITHQRKLLLDAVTGDPAFLTGMVGQSAFNREIANSRVTVSPFGWGELCLRDFECVRNGSLLLKPDMSHLETWPDVFVPGETYVPFDWDCKTVRERAHDFLENEPERRRIANNAFSAYAEALTRTQERFSAIIEEILS
jgi:hypothetical protein